MTQSTVTNTSECLNVTEEELQFVALQALSAVLCCGPCFDPSILAEEGPLYPWLDTMLASKDEKVRTRNIFDLFNKKIVFLTGLITG